MISHLNLFPRLTLSHKYRRPLPHRWLLRNQLQLRFLRQQNLHPLPRNLHPLPRNLHPLLWNLYPLPRNLLPFLWNLLPFLWNLLPLQNLRLRRKLLWLRLRRRRRNFSATFRLSRNFVAML